MSVINLKNKEQELYEAIVKYHFDNFGYFGSMFPSWDYFGKINEDGRKILHKIKIKNGRSKYEFKTKI